MVGRLTQMTQDLHVSPDTDSRAEDDLLRRVGADEAGTRKGGDCMILRFHIKYSAVDWSIQREFLSLA